MRSESPLADSSAMLGWDDELALKRQRMVEEQIRRRGVRDPRVLAALARVPRHRFVPEEYLDLAYDDRPLPIPSPEPSGPS